MLTIWSGMLERLKELFEFAAKNGLYLPGAYDARTGQASVSLLLVHTANIIASVGVIVSIYKDYKFGVVAAICYAVIMLAFYLMRSLSKFKVDVDDGEIELDSAEEKEENGSN